MQISNFHFAICNPTDTSLHLDAVRLDLVVKRLAADAEAFGGFEFVTTGFLQHLHDRVAFHTFKEREGLIIGTTLLPLLAAIAVGRMKNYGGVT